jgi:hypothetical protein
LQERSISFLLKEKAVRLVRIIQCSMGKRYLHTKHNEIVGRERQRVCKT